MMGPIQFSLGMVALVGAAPAFAQGVTPSQTPPSAAPDMSDPDTARLAAATRAADALVPDGVYLRMMRDQFPAMMDAMMGEMMGMEASSFVPGATEGSMAEVAKTADPAFEERMRIMSRVMGEEMGGLMGSMEPKVRAGLARVFARKFTSAQLTDMNAFFATPSGRIFASEYLTSFADPEMMREMASAAPEMMRAMPEIMKKVEAATAHLPPPPKAEAATPDAVEPSEATGATAEDGADE